MDRNGIVRTVQFSGLIVKGTQVVLWEKYGIADPLRFSVLDQTEGSHGIGVHLW